MKCPECKYVSHDYLERCRKCGVDLVAFKRDMGLLVHPPGVLDLSLVLGRARVREAENRLPESALPGPLTLALDASETMGNWSSSTLDDVCLDDPPSDVRSMTAMPQNGADDSEALQLDLEAFEIDADPPA